MAAIKSITLSKEDVGLAGEYAVASELCKRGFYAQLTLGNHKKTDILVETDSNLFRVSVKSKTGNQWPSVKGIWAPGDLLIFVDFKGKTANERPDFYVLNVDKWQVVIKKLCKDKSGSKIDKKTNTIYWPPWERNDKGWHGCSMCVKDVVEYKDCWPIE